MNTKEFNRYLQLIRDGNNYGMAKIYEKYYEKVKFTARINGNNKEDAEDIASNVMMSILKNAAGYGYVEHPNAWMYKASINAIVNFRKRNSRYVYTESMDETYSAKDDKIDLKLDFKRVVEKLPKRQQEIVLLHYVFGFKIRETAREVGLSVSTVNRELKSLKNELKKFL